MNRIASNKLRYINFFATIAIILTHCNIGEFNSENQIYKDIVAYFLNLAIIAMPCFFFITSYFFFKGYKQEMYKEKIKKRIYTLIIPYLLWNLLAYIGLIITKKNQLSLTSFIKAFIFIYFPNSDSIIASANTPLWYIIRIMSYMILAPIIYKICIKKNRFYIFFIISILINLVLKTNYYSFMHWLPIFLTGAYVALNLSEKFENLLVNQSRKYFEIIFIIIFLLLTFLFDFLYKNYDSWYLRYIIRNTAILIVYFLSCVVQIKKTEIRSFITQSPFYFYCAHILVISMIKPIVMKIDILNNELVLYITLVTCTILLLYISFKFLKKFMPKIFNVLTGNRASN